MIPEDPNKDGNAEAFFLCNDPDDKEYDVIFHHSAGPYLISHEALHVTLAICSACFMATILTGEHEILSVYLPDQFDHRLIR